MTGFVFLGDQGTGREGQLAVAAQVADWCEAHPCDFGVLLGDNVYPKGPTGPEDPRFVEVFEAPYGGLPFPFYAALGNHDRDGDWTAELAWDGRSNWNMPDRRYSVRVGEVQLVVLDTQTFSTGDLRWVRRQLRRSEAPLTVVAGHHPVRSSGPHGDTGRLAPLIPDLERWADLAIAGHDHHLEVLAGPPTYVVSGGGGAPPRPVTPGSESIFAASTLGFGYVLVDGEVATLSLVGVDGAVLYEMKIPLRN